MWTTIDGWKRWIGLAIAVLGFLACVEASGLWSFASVLACVKNLASGDTLTGVGIGVGAVGVAHANHKKTEQVGT